MFVTMRTRSTDALGVNIVLSLVFTHAYSLRDATVLSTVPLITCYMYARRPRHLWSTPPTTFDDFSFTGSDSCGGSRSVSLSTFDFAGLGGAGGGGVYLFAGLLRGDGGFFFAKVVHYFCIPRLVFRAS